MHNRTDMCFTRLSPINVEFCLLLNRIKADWHRNVIERTKSGPGVVLTSLVHKNNVIVLLVSVLRDAASKVQCESSSTSFCHVAKWLFWKFPKTKD